MKSECGWQCHCIVWFANSSSCPNKASHGLWIMVRFYMIVRHLEMKHSTTRRKLSCLSPCELNHPLAVMWHSCNAQNSSSRLQNESRLATKTMKSKWYNRCVKYLTSWWQEERGHNSWNSSFLVLLQCLFVNWDVVPVTDGLGLCYLGNATKPWCTRFPELLLLFLV